MDLTSSKLLKDVFYTSECCRCSASAAPRLWRLINCDTSLLGENTKSSSQSHPSSLCLLSRVFCVNLTALMRSLGATPTPPPIYAASPPGQSSTVRPYWLLFTSSWSSPIMSIHGANLKWTSVCVCVPSSPPSALLFSDYFCAASPHPQLSTLTVHAAGSSKSTKPSFECYLCFGIRERFPFRMSDQKRFWRFPSAWLEDCAPLCATHFPPYVTASFWPQACPWACALSLVQD